MDWFTSSGILFSCLLISCWGLQTCNGLGKFELDFHHRFSDRVIGFFPGDMLPSRDSSEYYRVMTHRDRLIRSNRLASGEYQSLVTFADGNVTMRIDTLGYLHYANVTVGTPPKWFLVALDTGSDLFWLPCDCSNCVQDLQSSNGKTLNLNIYSPSSSSTSAKVPCNSTLCTLGHQCSSPLSSCPYQVRYVSNDTSSSGFLVEDTLHLVTNNNESKSVNARITLGCGKVQTGVFHEGAAPNGLFGLGLEDISVPSILAKKGISANSFSMCFGHDRSGRISFGDEGSLDQRETPFNIRQSHPTYNTTVTQISIGGNSADLEFSVIFDSGTSFTYIADPAYTLITKTFDSLALDKRYSADDMPFEYCYALSPNKDSFEYPAVNLTMKGGDIYPVNEPLAMIPAEDVNFYCLAIVKSEDVSIIGQNFMTGYRIVFDREKMVLGWKESDCYTGESSSVLKNRSSAKAPASSVNPEATVIPSQSSNSFTSSWSPSHSHFLSLLFLSFLALC